MSYPPIIHSTEKKLLDDLQENYIPPNELCRYYVLLIGLRLRLFEGILGDFLRNQGIQLKSRDTLWPKVKELQKLTNPQTQLSYFENHRNLSDLLGSLNRIRNTILHGDFTLAPNPSNIETLKTIFRELCNILLFVETTLSTISSGTFNGWGSVEESSCFKLKTTIDSL
ncbi:MAG: hypothetical protein ACKO34_07895 [Vampirovibrionales bacterium]